jgi:hypothetical protein
MKPNRRERRMFCRRVLVDRRRDDDDVIEHVIRGVRREYVRATGDDRAPRVKK